MPLKASQTYYIFLYLFKMFVRSVPVPSCQRSCEDISFNIGILLWLPDIFRPTGFLVERTWDASTKCVGPSSRASGGGRLCAPYPHLLALRRRSNLSVPVRSCIYFFICSKCLLEVSQYHPANDPVRISLSI